jgi:hypothetical protein
MVNHENLLYGADGHDRAQLGSTLNAGAEEDHSCRIASGEQISGKSARRSGADRGQAVPVHEGQGQSRIRVQDDDHRGDGGQIEGGVLSVYGNNFNGQALALPEIGRHEEGDAFFRMQP